MPKIKKFEGYSSIKSGITSSLGKASKIINLIINKGQLCNIPYPQSIHSVGSYNPINPYTVGIYKDKVASDLIVQYVFYRVFTGNDHFNNIYISSITESTPTSINQNLQDFWRPGFDPKFSQNNYHLALGKFFQVGRAIYFLALNTGRMIRLFPRKGINGQTIVSLVGIKAPSAVTFSAYTGTGLTGTFSFAFSFTHKKQGIDTSNPADGVDDTVYYGVDDVIESNVVAQSSNTVYANQNGIYKVFIPEGQLEPLVGVIGIWVKTVDQDFWYYVESVNITDTTRVDHVTDQSGGSHFLVTVNNITQDPFTVAEFSKRSVPSMSHHAIQYKDRIYYANGTIGAANNKVEYTPKLASVGEKGANYIENSVLVGNPKESICGFIEYLGQLIIQKETETYVLTDDILIGDLRLLFSDKGGINILGGSAQININNKIYFVAQDFNVYMYNGVGDPIEVSKDIEEDLLKINRNQFRFARFGHDPENKLLYLIIPQITESNNVTPSFIYHYEELDEQGIGIWTKYNLGLIKRTREHFPSISEINDNNRTLLQMEIIDDNFVLMFHKNIIYIMGSVEDSLPIGIFAHRRYWVYQTGVMTFDDITMEKHFKMFKLQSSIYLQNIIEKVDVASDMNLNLINGKEYSSGNPAVDRFQTIQLTSSGEKNIGMFAEELSIEFMPNDVGDRRHLISPFRIFGYEVDVSNRSRR